jgi:hypothetical protein
LTERKLSANRRGAGGLASLNRLVEFRFHIYPPTTTGRQSCVQTFRGPEMIPGARFYYGVVRASDHFPIQSGPLFFAPYSGYSRTYAFSKWVLLTLRIDLAVDLAVAWTSDHMFWPRRRPSYPLPGLPRRRPRTPPPRPTSPPPTGRSGNPSPSPSPPESRPRYTTPVPPVPPSLAYLAYSLPLLGR